MLRNKVNKELKDLNEKKELSSEDYRRLYINTNVTPRFYVTIKIHKENNPIRPIVAFNPFPPSVPIWHRLVKLSFLIF